MTDLLSIIAGVLAIATATIQSSKRICELVSDIRECPKEIAAITRNAQAFCTVLSSLSALLRDDDVKEIISGDDIMFDMIENLKDPLEHCRLVLEGLTVKIQKHTKPNVNGKGFRLNAAYLKWGILTKGEIKDLQLRLESTKSTLNGALDALTTYVLVASTCSNNTNAFKTL